MNSIVELGELLRTRRVSAVELTQDCLARIERLNPVLNAFITVTADLALAQARQADEEIQGGQWRGPVHGIPVGIKDLIDIAGVPTTAASAAFRDRVPTEDAEVVRLLKNAGAVLLGKQNMHECAYGGSSVISAYGPVRNAWDPACFAGGSSGGSATAVAAGLGYAALGTDTAGSVRQPAALCGVVGIKPSYGLVSVCGVIPLSPSLDHIGPITRTVADAALLLQIIAENPRHNYFDAMLRGASVLRVGVPRGFFFEGLDDEVASAVEEALAVIAKMTASMSEIKLEVIEDRTLQKAESFAAHAALVARSPELYQPETLRRIRSGESISTGEINQSRRELERVRREIEAVFADVDVLVTPSTPIAAPSLAELTENSDQLRPREVLLLRNTRPFNVWGLPAISVPCGFTKLGLPIGLQIAGPRWGENKVLQLAHAYEQATEWHKRRPQE